MKTKATKTLVMGILVIAVLASCNKHNDAPSVNTVLLTQRTWKFEIYGLDENNNDIIDAGENSMLACEADDIFTFNVNGTGVFARGTLQCSAGEPATTSFNWTFSNHETELAIFAAPEKINRLDENILEVYYMDQNSLGQSVKYIRRFQH